LARKHVWNTFSFIHAGFEMAKRDLVSLLLHGVDEWNAWRESAARGAIDFASADLSGKDLSGADLGGADFRGAKLTEARLCSANLDGADFGGADLCGANAGWASLTRANFSYANLSGADLAGADLLAANLVWANLANANLGKTWLGDANLNGARLNATRLHGARLHETVLAGVDLSTVIGLESCRYFGPSIVDYRTLEMSWPLPLEFLRGVGFPDSFIEHLPSLLNRGDPSCRCYISYASDDQEFVGQLHADLQRAGVRCWLAPDDVSVGAAPWDAIDDTMRLQDKLLLVLSENIIRSNRIEDEVEKVFAEELEAGRQILFPMRIDEEAVESARPWVQKLRERGCVGDFSKWRVRDAYRASLDELLRGLRGKTCAISI
jgi:uncharacterized protein YjbI with pentapeptide repeats